MKNILYLNITRRGFGLTNQIFTLVNGIINAYKNDKNIIIVGEFSVDYSTESLVPISTIFNINKINAFLKEKYGILIFDKTNIEFNVLSVKYGKSKEDALDITEYVSENLSGDNVLLFSKSININTVICEDPCEGERKSVFLDYSINNIEFQYVQPECYDYLTDDITFHLSDAKFIDIYNIWIDALDRTMFDDILQNIHYHSDLLDIANDFIKTINLNNHINVIHLRLEPDAIAHWSQINKIDKPTYKYKIENKYVSIIDRYINKNDCTIVLSYSKSNRVLDFMNQNGYNYFIPERQYGIGREKNAIIDLLISNLCNNILLGNFNLENLNGSSFSYYLLQVNPDVKKILIDLDNINTKEYIYHPPFTQCSIPKTYT